MEQRPENWAANTTSQQKQPPTPLLLSSLFLGHQFEFLDFYFYFLRSCTREKPIISQWRRRFLLCQTSFSLRFLLHCSLWPLTPTPPPSSFLFLFFLALWNWSVHPEKKGNECTLDSALNRLTHFIDDADDTLLMILIKVCSWQADPVHYDSDYCAVSPEPTFTLWTKKSRNS